MPESKLRYVLGNPLRIVPILLARLPWFRWARATTAYQNQSTIGQWFAQKVLGIGGNRAAYWPVHPSSQVTDAHNIYAGVDTCPGLMKGCYIQGRGGIWFGDYTQIAPGVAVVSANHDPHDLRRHINAPVRIGAYGWLGAGAKVMPGVALGDFTVVAAGAVVTKSFPEGYVVLAGVPARPIRTLDRAQCVRYELSPRYHGFLDAAAFAEYRRRSLRIDEIFPPLDGSTE